MAHIAALFSRVLRTPAPPSHAAVHFHGGPLGAYVCDNAHCESPGLDPAAA